MANERQSVLQGEKMISAYFENRPQRRRGPIGECLEESPYYRFGKPAVASQTEVTSVTEGWPEPKEEFVVTVDATAAMLGNVAATGGETVA